MNSVAVLRENTMRLNRVQLLHRNEANCCSRTTSNDYGHSFSDLNVSHNQKSSSRAKQPSLALRILEQSTPTLHAPILARYHTTCMRTSVSTPRSKLQQNESSAKSSRVNLTIASSNATHLLRCSRPLEASYPT